MSEINREALRQRLAAVQKEIKRHAYGAFTERFVDIIFEMINREIDNTDFAGAHYDEVVVDDAPYRLIGPLWLYRQTHPQETPQDRCKMLTGYPPRQCVLVRYHPLSWSSDAKDHEFEPKTAEIETAEIETGLCPVCHDTRGPDGFCPQTHSSDVVIFDGGKSDVHVLQPGESVRIGAAGYIRGNCKNPGTAHYGLHEFIPKVCVEWGANEV